MAAGGHVEAEALARFVGNFAGVVAGMEERFVPLGEDLGDLVRHLHTLARSAGEGFGAIRQQMSHGPLGELDVRAGAAIVALKQQLGSVAHRMQPLAEVSDDLRRLRSLGNELHHIGTFLQACGSGFAVESARRDDSHAAFSAFVDELRGLATQIEVLATRMQEDSHTTLTQLGAARQRIEGNVAELARLAQAMQGAFSTASAEIGQLLADIRTVLDRVEEHRLAIAEQTGGVIYYLQFGDLVRQQCEHILVAAREALRAQEANSETLPIIVRTAAAQLELIQHEVDETRGKLADGYAGLEGRLRLLAACGAALSSPGHGGQEVAGDAWSRLKTRLQDLEQIQLQEDSMNADAVQTAEAAGTATASLHSGLGSVRGMSKHLHLLALNAIIQTARLGDHGRTLNALAQQVNELHRECEVLVPKVLGILAAIARRVATFSDQDGTGASLDLDDLEQLDLAQKSSQRVMAEVLRLAATGEGLLRRAVARLDTLDILSREIREHRAVLLSIASRLPDPPATASASASACAFDARMLECYTIQSERDAHLRSRGLPLRTKPVTPSPRSTGAVICAVAEPAGATATAGDDDCGDNFELF